MADKTTNNGIPDPMVAVGLGAAVQTLIVEVAVLKTKLDEISRALIAVSEINKGKDWVSRELHDQLYKEVMGRIESLKGEIDTTRGRSLAFAAIFAGLIAVAGLMLTAWHVFGGGVGH